MLISTSADSVGIARRGRGSWAYLRLAVLSVASGAAVFGAGFGLFANYVSELSAPKDVRPADAIIVLTGGQARLDAALGLLKSGKGKRLLISGVNPAASRESLRRAMGEDRNLFTCCIDLDHAALDTIGNAEESAKWVQDHDYDRVILVTNNYHMPRSLLEMSRLVDDTELQPYPVVNSRLSGGGWVTKPEAVRVIFTEYAKYVAALARSFVPMRGLPHDVSMEQTATIHQPSRQQ